MGSSRLSRAGGGSRRGGRGLLRPFVLSFSCFFLGSDEFALFVKVIAVAHTSRPCYWCRFIITKTRKEIEVGGEESHDNSILGLVLLNSQQIIGSWALETEKPRGPATVSNECLMVMPLTVVEGTRA